MGRLWRVRRGDGGSEGRWRARRGRRQWREGRVWGVGWQRRLSDDDGHWHLHSDRNLDGDDHRDFYAFGRGGNPARRQQSDEQCEKHDPIHRISSSELEPASCRLSQSLGPSLKEYGQEFP